MNLNVDFIYYLRLQRLRSNVSIHQAHQPTKYHLLYHPENLLCRIFLICLDFYLIMRFCDKFKKDARIRCSHIITFRKRFFSIDCPLVSQIPQVLLQRMII